MKYLLLFLRSLNKKLFISEEINKDNDLKFAYIAYCIDA